MKTLILTNDNSYGVLRCDDDVDVYNYYIDRFSIIRKICKRLFPFLLPIFYGKWVKKLNDYNKIILFDTNFNNELPKLIKAKNSKSKIYFWFWNKINSLNSSILNNKYIDEFYTYETFDCEKYNIKNNTQFYNKELVTTSKNIEFDFIFVGLSKNRGDIIEYVINILEQNYKVFKKIPKNKKEYMKYSDYLEKVSLSRCIIDIVGENVEGLTLRVMESLFFQKKLITNNKSILNYNFYNKSNIFIIGIDDIDKIDEFMSKEFVCYNDDLVDHYEYRNWLQRFK